MSQKAAGRRSSAMRRQIVDRRGGNGAPTNKSRGKPSREHIHSKRTTWLSLREKTDNRGNDQGARVGLAWFMAPIYKDARIERWK